VALSHSLRLLTVTQNMTIRQFLLGNLHRPANEKTYKFKFPLKILSSALGNLGDFPYKNPDEIRCEKPALFIRGTQSPYVPDEAIPIIGRFFPRFRLVDIDAGHWVISEKPELFRQGMYTCHQTRPLITDIRQLSWNSSARRKRYRAFLFDHTSKLA
jgi:pimeloyl-ACP methyl ester carboxylesterase